MKTIQLTNGGTALCDDEDYPVLSRHKWRGMKNYNTRYVVVAMGKSMNVFMHKMVFGSKAGYVIDHINHDGTDNQKKNLRFATAGHNTMNSRKHPGCTSKYKGVFWCKTNKHWYAYINANKVRHNLGRFDTEEEAAVAFNKAAKKHHGKFAFLNVITEALPDKEK